MKVLVVNPGSSSLKLDVVADGVAERSALLERWDGDTDAIGEFVDDTVQAVGCRVVHGGAELTQPVRIDAGVLAYLGSISDLAPLHNPRSVSAIEAVTTVAPALPAVAVFDTGFFATMPPAAATYALPREWNQRYGLRRYGFHGISHAYALRRAAQLAGRSLPQLRVVSCHLGAGASLCAARGGVAVDTTMGFTPLAGLVMKTRSGSIDPGLLLWLLDRPEIDPVVLNDALEHHSGLAGLSGTGGDLRDVLAARASGDADAGLAFDAFVHRLVREIGAMVASAGGLDLLVFTGGIGENSPEVRAAAAEALAYLGVGVDPAGNAAARGDTDITAAGAPVATVVVSAGEALEIARATEHCLADASGR